MFLVDKYSNEFDYISNNDILNKIIDSFDTYNKFFNDSKYVANLSNTEFIDIVKNLDSDRLRYSNFQHLIIYGPSGSGKDYIINKLLYSFFGKANVELKDIEYTLMGYSNLKTKIMIKQSKNHIVIEPNSNGFDKYLIQEIIKDYSKSNMLNILKQSKNFKIIIINKIDNLSYYAQASLRRTLEKYSDTCKFILVSDQLSKIIEPLRSRCIMLRVPLPDNTEIINKLLYISFKEKFNISFNKITEIVNKSDNKINIAVWLLEIFSYNIDYNINWETIIDKIINLIFSSINNNNKIHIIIKKIRVKFYLLFITNIPTQIIIKKIMNKLLNKVYNNILKYNIINITSIFENRLNQGTRHIIHIEAYVIKLIELFNTKIENISINI